MIFHLEVQDTQSNWFIMWVFPKIVVFTPQIIYFNRVFHDFHHPFWGTLIFGNNHVNWLYVPGSINSHYFHIIGDGHQPNSRGLFTNYKDSY